ncbi:MAG: MBL fold metallo-hydrolase [Candidatus Odinarchaeia archaeon]
MRKVLIYTLADNSASDSFSSTWGFSLFLEMQTAKKQKISAFMDVNGNLDILIKNADKFGLKLDKLDVDFIFISHWHKDHYGALNDLTARYIEKKPVTLYVPNPPPVEIADSLKINILNKGGRLFNNCFSTGKLGEGIPEHSLVIDVENKGLIVLCGCSHPGIRKILTAAIKVSENDNVYAVIGGFHANTIKDAISLLETFEEFDVKKVAPSHCTSISVKRFLKKKLGDRYLENKAGYRIEISS